MNIQTTLLKGASLTMSAGAMAFKGTKFVCSQGHNVATGLRKTADAVDYISTVGERKSQNAINYCLYAKEDYEKKILEITKQAVNTLKDKGVEVTEDMLQNIVQKAAQFCKEEDEQKVVNTTNQEQKEKTKITTVNVFSSNNDKNTVNADKKEGTKTNKFEAFASAVASNI